MRHINKAYIFVLVVTLSVLSAFPAAAETVTIDIFGPGQSKLGLVMADPMGEEPGSQAPAKEGRELLDRLKANFNYLPFLKQIEANTILGGPRVAGHTRTTIDFRRFQLAEADILLVTRWPGEADSETGGRNIEIRAFEVYTQRLMVGKAYFDITPDRMQEVADKFSEALMRALTGRGEFFRSTLAFVKREEKRGPKEIWTIRPTGRNLRQISKFGTISMSPSWSNDARYIIFTNIGERYHSLGIWDRNDNSVRRVRYPGNTIIGPCFLPDNTVAVSLASGGNPDIYQLNHVFRKQRVLVQNWAIDVSPSFSRDGKKMAFVSSRFGNPHIFLKDLETNEEKRVTYSGKYNTHPSLSPDGTLVTFSRRTPQGHRIFVHDLVTGRERQISFGPGSDEQPSFGPDGYFIAFTSTRSGKHQIYLVTRHGGEPKLVPTGPGEASFPAWGLEPE